MRCGETGRGGSRHHVALRFDVGAHGEQFVDENDMTVTGREAEAGKVVLLYSVGRQRKGGGDRGSSGLER
jgi:hypothetical protein